MGLVVRERKITLWVPEELIGPSTYNDQGGAPFVEGTSAFISEDVSNDQEGITRIAGSSIVSKLYASLGKFKGILHRQNELLASQSSRQSVPGGPYGSSGFDTTSHTSSKKRDYRWGLGILHLRSELVLRLSPWRRLHRAWISQASEYSG